MPKNIKDAYDKMHEQLHKKPTMKRWRIVSFDHPARQKSVLYLQNISDERLIEAIKESIKRNANLMSIRGFTEGEN